MTLDELRAAYEEAKEKALGLQTQLTVKKPVGKVSDDAFQKWQHQRASIVGAWRTWTAKASRLKKELKDRNRNLITTQNGTSKDLAFADLESAAGLLRAGYTLLKRLGGEIDGGLDQDEQAVVNAMQKWLDKEEL